MSWLYCSIYALVLAWPVFSVGPARPHDEDRLPVHVLDQEWALQYHAVQDGGLNLLIVLLSTVFAVYRSYDYFTAAMILTILFSLMCILSVLPKYSGAERDNGKQAASLSLSQVMTGLVSFKLLMSR
jgi:uncharacterized membrane protein YhaH (DUF805 family)